VTPRALLALGSPFRLAVAWWANVLRRV